MDCLDLNKVTCRICITGDDQHDELSNLFTKTINESPSEATKSIDDEQVLNMPISEALESFTCIEVRKYFFFVFSSIFKTFNFPYSYNRLGCPRQFVANVNSN